MLRNGCRFVYCRVMPLAYLASVRREVSRLYEKTHLQKPSAIGNPNYAFKKSEIEIPKSEINYSIPPSTGITCPVMYDAISDARNTQQLATSSVSPPRFNGMACAQPSTTLGSSTSVISVFIKPGATTLVRILR